MKPQDVIEQLVGEGTGWDQQDTMAFTIYKPSKFPKMDNVCIDFEKGTVDFYNEANAKTGTVTERYTIKASLEPLDVEPSQGDEYAGEEDHP